MNPLKLLIWLPLAAVVFGGISLSFAEDLPVGPLQWGAGRPLYSQHAWEKNLLRYHAGGRVYGSDDGVWRMTDVIQESSGNERALICDDPTVTVRLEPGERNFDYALGQRFLLRRVTFMNEGVEGTVELSVAAIDPAKGNGRWVPIASREVRAEEREQIIRFAAVDCRYVRLRFLATTAGQIHGLGAFGIRKAVEFYDPAERGVRAEPRVLEAAAGVGAGDDRLDVDELGPLVSVDALDSSVTNAIGWSRVERVSSAAEDDTTRAAHILDEDSTTAFQFSETDKAPTLVIDLGKEFDCGRVSVLYDRGERGEMKLWLADGGGDSADLAPESGGLKLKLARSLNDEQGRGRISFNEFRRAGRYVVLQWLGENAGTGSFGIHEVAVFEHLEAGEAIVSSLVPRKPVTADGVTPFDTSGHKIQPTGTTFKRPIQGTGGGIEEPPVSR